MEEFPFTLQGFVYTLWPRCKIVAYAIYVPQTVIFWFMLIDRFWVGVHDFGLFHLSQDYSPNLTPITHCLQ